MHIAPAIGRVLKVRSKINLGGSADSQVSVGAFAPAVSRVPNVVILAPLSLLKSSDLASKVAVSSATDMLSDRS